LNRRAECVNVSAMQPPARQAWKQFAGKVAAGLAWLLSERWRWFVIPLTLAIGAGVVWQRFTTMPHHLPGRWLFLIDEGLTLGVSAMTLAAPLLCRWLRGHSTTRIVRSSPPAPLHRPQASDSDR